VAETIAYQILQAIAARLRNISTAGGYNTDPAVLVGVQPVNPDQVEAGPIIVAYELRDQPANEQQVDGDQAVQLTIVVEAVVEYGAAATALMLSQVWQDIMRSVFTTDSTLGGLALSVQRGQREYEYPSPGGNTVAVRQAVTVVYWETYGNP
jgi:hypothetical protein